MIDLKEFRHGNYFHIEGMGHYPVSDFSIDFTGKLSQIRFLSALVFRKERIPDQTIEVIIPELWQVKPISLMPEILEKCSGPYSSLYYYKNHDEMGFQIGEMRVTITGGGVHDSGGFIVRRGPGIRELPKMEYLHQLQNLYFALTGDELEVKL